MTKIELMDYCWCRDFNFNDLQHIAAESGSTDIPALEEYSQHCKDSFEGMLRFMDKQYEDHRTEREKARQEMGMTFQECER